MALTSITFTDGKTINVQDVTTKHVVGYIPTPGLDLLVAGDDSLRFPLTPCCYASGKGSGASETGVVCRACYEDVDGFFGMAVDSHDMVAVAE